MIWGESSGRDAVMPHRMRAFAFELETKTDVIRADEQALAERLAASG
jgi:hypothetical protein